LSGFFNLSNNMKKEIKVKVQHYNISKSYIIEIEYSDKLLKESVMYGMSLLDIFFKINNILKELIDENLEYYDITIELKDVKF
jgi:hypothetical protein